MFSIFYVLVYEQILNVAEDSFTILGPVLSQARNYHIFSGYTIIQLLTLRTVALKLYNFAFNDTLVHLEGTKMQYDNRIKNIFSVRDP